jgi:iron complex transport system substrate-binding protein
VQDWDFESIMIRCTSVVALIALMASSVALGAAPAERVVSLDYCADQFVLKLLPRDRILAVSPDAGKEFSYMRDFADGLQRVRPRAEDVLTIRPDLVVRSYGGGPHIAGFFERAGIPVLQVPFANDLASIRKSILYLAEGLGVPERGSEIVAEMNRRLKNIDKLKVQKTALYMTPTGVTGGPGTAVHNMLQAAGLENFQEQPGWRSIPLERLAYEQPDVIAAAFFSSDTIHPALWSPMRHPVARQQMSNQPTVMLQGAWTSCGGWFLLDAIEALASTASAVSPQ